MIAGCSARQTVDLSFQRKSPVESIERKPVPLCAITNSLPMLHEDSADEEAVVPKNGAGKIHVESEPTLLTIRFEDLGESVNDPVPGRGDSCCEFGQYVGAADNTDPAPATLRSLSKRSTPGDPQHSPQFVTSSTPPHSSPDRIDVIFLAASPP